MHYTVTCEGEDADNNAELLVANVDDVYKLIKTESKVIKFMKEQYVQKFPSQKPADDFFKGVFSGKAEKSKMLDDPTPAGSTNEDERNITK